YQCIRMDGKVHDDPNIREFGRSSDHDSDSDRNRNAYSRDRQWSHSQWSHRKPVECVYSNDQHHGLTGYGRRCDCSETRKLVQDLVIELKTAVVVRSRRHERGEKLPPRWCEVAPQHDRSVSKKGLSVSG